MTSHTKLDTAILAGSGVVAADQIMQAIRDHKDKHPDDATAHYVKAAIAGAVAIGAYEMLKKDENLKANWNPHDEKNVDSDMEHHGAGTGHGRHILEEAVGAYALGRQMMGHRNHPIVKLVAEALGAAGLYQEAKHDL